MKATYNYEYNIADDEKREAYIKTVCERAAKLCANPMKDDIAYQDKNMIHAYSYSNIYSSEKNTKILEKLKTEFNKRISENVFPDMMFGMNPKDKNIVRNWYDFKQGEKYYIWSKRILPEDRKIYELKYIIKELNGDILNICIMKQCAGPKSKMFTLTESDCEHINIDFEYGLEVYPVNICWVKHNQNN